MGIPRQAGTVGGEEVQTDEVDVDETVGGEESATRTSATWTLAWMVAVATAGGRTTQIEGRLESHREG